MQTTGYRPITETTIWTWCLCDCM